jgi:DeoR/GlpR family transcriptional regulator of sugar metabolism
MLNSRQSRILPLVQQRGRVTTGELVRAFRCHPETIRRDLAYLVKIGLLEKHGSKRGTFYTFREVKKWTGKRKRKRGRQRRS